MIHETIRVRSLVEVYLRDRQTGDCSLVARGSNLLTTAGSEHYAQLLAGGTPPNAFEALVLGTGAATPAVGDTLANITQVAGSLKLLDAGYPKANDDDTGNANRGAKRVTYRCTYAASEANATGITRIAVVNFRGGAPGTAEPLLLHASITSFNKTGSNELIVYVNHAIEN